MTGVSQFVTALTLLLGGASPGVQPASVAAGVVPRVPVLMYHVIADPPPGATWPLLYVAPSEFAEQMRWLDRNGYEAVTLSEVWRNWHGGRPLPARPVVLTFDDGYVSVARNAVPLLAARGWPAVLNLKIGNLAEPWGISARRVRQLVAAGWELGDHTYTHPDLRGLDDRALEREIADSRTELRRRFHTPVNFFCYPAGRYSDRVIAAVRRAGFLGATTTIPGFATAARPFELRRIRVNRGDGSRGLAGVLPGRSAASR